MSIRTNIGKRKKGFTLIELIIVIAIIAILAAIAIPNFLAIQRKARVKADIATAKNIYDATATMITEGKVYMPTGVGEDTGFSINFANDNSKVNKKNLSYLKSYLQDKDVTIQSITGAYFNVNVTFEEKNGVKNLNNPIIKIYAVKDRVIGELYPKQTEEFKLI